MPRTWTVCIIALLLVIAFEGTGRAQENTGNRARTYILSISVTGSGRVTGEGIRCSALCNIALPAGTEVVLKAVPMEGWHFVEWSGDCRKKGDCAIRMDGDKSAGAIFTYP